MLTIPGTCRLGVVKKPVRSLGSLRRQAFRCRPSVGSVQGLLRDVPWLSPGRQAQEFVGCIIPVKTLSDRVPLQFPLDLAGDVPDLGHRTGTVPDLRIGQRALARFDAIEEVAFLVFPCVREIVRLHFCRED